MERIEEGDIVGVVSVTQATRVDIRMTPPEFKKICLSLGYTFKSGTDRAHWYTPIITMARYRIKDGFASFWSR